MFCYGCGATLSSRRYRLWNPSHAKALKMWKKLAAERFSELGVESMDLNVVLDADGNAGRVCHKCLSDLERLEKLECVQKLKIG